MSDDYSYKSLGSTPADIFRHIGNMLSNRAHNFPHTPSGGLSRLLKGPVRAIAQIIRNGGMPASHDPY